MAAARIKARAQHREYYVQPAIPLIREVLTIKICAVYVASWNTDYAALVVRHHRLETYDKVCTPNAVGALGSQSLSRLMMITAGSWANAHSPVGPYLAPLFQSRNTLGHAIL
jgi:hypothetical protein